MTSWQSRDLPDQVLLKHKSKLTGDWWVFRFPQRSVDGKRLMRFQNFYVLSVSYGFSVGCICFQKLIQSMSAKEVTLQRLNNGKLLLEQRLDEVLKQKEREQAVSCDSNRTCYN